MIGGLDALELIGDHFKSQGTLWAAIGILNDKFGNLGFIIIDVFVFSWIASLMLCRWNRHDEIEMNV